MRDFDAAARGAHRAFGEAVDVWAIGQEAAGNAVLLDRYGLTLPLLDDSELRVSFGYDLDTVPTVILSDGAGGELRRFVGFGRNDFVPHPIQDATDDEMRAKADAILDEVIAALVD